MESNNPEFHPRNNCPLCRSDNLNDVFALDGIRVAACGACGFRFSRDILSAAALDQHYVDGYADRRQLDGQRVNASINIELIRDFCPNLSGKSLLDVGSGYGMFLNRVRNSGARRTTGIELSRAERQYSVEKVRLETLAQIDDLSRSRPIRHYLVV
jgi:transcription elongation factor Elf1